MAETRTPADSAAELGTELRHLRKEARLTGEALAHTAGMSQSKVSKIETGRQIPTASDIEKIGDALGLSVAKCKELVARAENLRVDFALWRTQQSGWTSDVQAGVQEREAAAISIKALEIVTYPALLQTAGYAREVLAKALRPFDEVNMQELEAAVSARLQRQEILFDESRRFQFLMPEAALKFRYGGWSTMQAQIDRVQSLATLTHISIGIVPWRCELPVVPGEAAVLYDDELVETETESGPLLVRGAEEVGRYRRIFDALWNVALLDDEADQLLASAQEELTEATKTMR
jgi:transcriptional regulator with XRE-family HTH domain